MWEGRELGLDLAHAELAFRLLSTVQRRVGKTDTNVHHLRCLTPSGCCCCIASVMPDSVRPHRRQPTRLPRPWDSPGKNTGVGLTPSGWSKPGEKITLQAFCRADSLRPDLLPPLLSCPLPTHARVGISARSRKAKEPARGRPPPCVCETFSPSYLTIETSKGGAFGQNL